MEINKKIVLVIDELQTPTKTLGNENIVLLKENFKVEFWDIRGLNATWKINRKDFRFLDEQNFDIYYIKSKEDLFKGLSRLKSEAIPVAFLFSGKIRWWSRIVFLGLKKFSFPFFVRRNKTHPFVDNPRFKGLIYDRIKSRRRKILSVIRHQLPVDRLLNIGIPNPVKVFAGTRFDLGSINFKYKAQDVIFTHFKDYDHFLRLRQSQPAPEKYIAYMDQYYPFHPELKELKIDADDYYFSLCKFLNAVSKTTGWKVVVCLHPIADMKIMDKYFAGFEVYWNQTIEMLSKAEFGIFFNSSAILSSLFLKKPILLIKSERTLPPQISQGNKLYEELFDVKSMDIDSEVTEVRLSAVLNAQRLGLTELFNDYIKYPDSANDLEYLIIARQIGSCI